MIFFRRIQSYSLFVSVKRKSRRVSFVERKKRVCNRMVCSGDLFGASVDALFFQDENEISRRVTAMNHSTRFWLAVKFVRKDKNDYQPNANLKFRYCERKICKLLDVDRSSVRRLFNRHKSLRLSEILPIYRFLSPIEASPKGHEKFFEKIASNYQDLIASEFFN